MNDAVRTVPPVGDAPPEASGVVEHVRAAVAGLTSAEGSRDEAVARAAQVFQQVAATGEDRAEVARALLTALDAKVLHGVDAPGGLSVRAEAIEAVIRLGYPWALQLDPDDVAFLRPARRAPVIRRWVTRAAVALFVVSGLGAGWLSFVSWKPETIPTRPPVVAPPTPTPPELKTMLSTAQLSALVTQAQQSLERRDDRRARWPLERCLDADAAQLTCLRLLGEVEARQARLDRDPAAMERAHDLARRYLAAAPSDDAFRARVEGLLLEETPVPVTPSPKP